MKDRLVVQLPNGWLRTVVTDGKRWTFPTPDGGTMTVFSEEDVYRIGTEEGLVVARESQFILMAVK